MNIKEYLFNNQQYFEDFITRSTYHSNGIEGNTLSYAETNAILFGDNKFKGAIAAREYYEVINHKNAMIYLFEHLENELSEKMIKEIAKQINRNISEISGYRKVSVRLNGANYMPPKPEQIPQLMLYYVYNYNHTEYKDIFHKTAETHIQYERIHPFEDGNGRTGRLMLNYELLKNNIAPIIIPKEQRTEYFQMIENRDSFGLAEYLRKLSAIEQKRISNIKDKE